MKQSMKRRRPRGRVRLYRDTILVFETDNLVVNSGLTALAQLLGGNLSGESVLAAGFGSGSTAPAVTDTDLSSSPKYYNAIGAATFPTAGTVQFVYALTANTDYGAGGITVAEIGLFGNTGTVGLPAAVGTANPAWSGTTAYSVGALIVDTNGNIQRCTTAGTSGASAPSWATSVGGTTSDGSAVWTLVALHSPPAPIIARALVPSVLFNNTASYQGTWQITM